MAELTEEIVEEVLEEQLIETVGRQYFFGGLILGLVVGGVTAWLVTDRRLAKKYERVAETEIDDMREHFRARLIARDEKPPLSSLGRLVEEENYASKSEDPSTPGELNTQVERTPEQQNVFDRINTEKDASDGWDYDIEKAARTREVPYVIHYDERGETNYEEVTLTYYTADDVLCDDKDKVVDDQDRVVGLQNLDKFGHGSNDAEIVYVRNEYLSLDIEVVRSPNSYAEEVHGFTHEDPPRRREYPEWH